MFKQSKSGRAPGRRAAAALLALCMLLGLVEPGYWGVQRAAAAEDTVIDFSACSAAGHDKDPAHATLAECGWELDTERSTDQSSFDVFEAGEGGLQAQLNYTTAPTNPGNLYIKFNLETGGYYQVHFLGTQTGYTGWTRYTIDDQGLKAGSHCTGSEVELGKVYLAAGTHTLRMELISNRAFYPKKLRLTPQAVAEGEFSIQAAAIEPFAEGTRADAALTITKTADESNLNADRVDVRLTVADPTVASAEAVATGEGAKVIRVSGLSAGETQITAELMMGGAVIASTSLDVTVTGAQFEGQTVDFGARYRATGDGDPAKANFAEDGWRMNFTEGDGPESFDALELTAQGLRGVRKAGNTGAVWLCYDVDVAENGYYEISLTHNAADTTYTYFYLDDVSYGGHRANYEGNSVSQVATCYLAEGAHVVWIESRKDTDGTEIYLEKMSLRKLAHYQDDPTQTVALSIGAFSELAAGDALSQEIKLTVGGSVQSLGSAAVSAVSLDEDVAKAEVVAGKYRAKNLKITGVGGGETQIRVTADFGGGFQVETLVAVTVSGEPLVKLYEQVIDFTQCYLKGHSSDVKHASVETCGWALNSQSTKAGFKTFEMNENGIAAELMTAATDNAAGRLELFLDFKVEKGGYYMLEYTNAANDQTGWARQVFRGSWLTGENFKEGLPTYLRNGKDPAKFYLDAGVETIRFQVATGFGIFPTMLRLVEVPVPKGSLALTMGALDTVQERATGIAALQVKQNQNGVEIPGDQVEIAARAADPSVADVKVGKNGTVKELQVTGKKPGATAVTVEVLMCGKVFASSQTDVTVTPWTGWQS